MMNGTNAATPATPSPWLKVQRIAVFVFGLLSSLGVIHVANKMPATPAPGTATPLVPAIPAPMPEASPNAAPSAKKPPTPREAIGRIQFGNAGCSATILGPRRPDGRYDVMTAAHCLKGQPHEGMMMLRNGLSLKLTFVTMDEHADVCWLVTTLPQTDLPYALLASELPKAGDRVWHSGYGVDKPGNVESGTVTVPDNGDGQTQYELSVSSGDSGGGIALNDRGEILSPVCCTSAKGRKAMVFGATVLECLKTRPIPQVVFDEWTPIEIPIRKDK